MMVCVRVKRAGIVNVRLTFLYVKGTIEIELSIEARLANDPLVMLQPAVKGMLGC